jgi:hypothetical protein
VAEIQGKGVLKAEATVERVLKSSPVSASPIFAACSMRTAGCFDLKIGMSAAAVASVEVVTRNIGDGEVEHVHKFKVWDINSALETLAKHLGCSSSVSSTLGA